MQSEGLIVAKHKDPEWRQWGLESAERGVDRGRGPNPTLWGFNQAIHAVRSRLSLEP